MSTSEKIAIGFLIVGIAVIVVSTIVILEGLDKARKWRK